jgi:cytochrome-b5 reductase
VGDKISVKGPFQKIKYIPNMKRSFGMIAGGTGITPMMQIIREVLSNPEDKTSISLVYANTHEVDILLKSEIDELCLKHSNLRVKYVVSHPAQPQWSEGEIGYINTTILRDMLPPPSDDILVFVCGPPGMMTAVSGASKREIGGMLKDLEFTG